MYLRQQIKDDISVKASKEKLVKQRAETIEEAPTPTF